MDNGAGPVDRWEGAPSTPEAAMFDFTLTETQRALRDEVRDFV